MHGGRLPNDGSSEVLTVGHSLLGFLTDRDDTDDLDELLATLDDLAADGETASPDS